MTLLIVALGLGLLLAGGTLLVYGASQIASSLGVSPMVVGLTIVGFGTSAPELVVNVIGALEGQTDLAFGNVVGSNIANLSLVLGAAALFQTISIRGELVLREVPLLLLATTSITVMALDGVLDGAIPLLSRSDATVLLLLFGIFTYITILDYLHTRSEDRLLLDVTESPLTIASLPGRYCWLQALAGAAMLGIGGEITIGQGAVLADLLGISPTIVGLFVVAIGTSMPELVTSTIAAIRGEADLALGNVIGSNLFNSLLVLPVSAILAPIAIPTGGITDLLVSLLLTAILIPLFLLGKSVLDRPTGMLLIVSYVAYGAYRVTQT